MSSSKQSSDCPATGGGGPPNGGGVIPPATRVWITRGRVNWNQGALSWTQARGEEPSFTVRLVVSGGMGQRKRRSPSGGSAYGMFLKL